MTKTSTGKKRGVQRGVAKHKMVNKAGKGNEGERLVFGVREAVYFSVARKCFEFCSTSGASLYLTPFTRTTNGQYIPRGRKGMLAHYSVWFLHSLLFLHKIWGFGSLLLYDELKIETFMCAANFLVYLASFLITLVMLVSPKETMDVLNSWPLILSCLKQAGKSEPTQYDDLSEAFKLISFLVVTQGVALSAAMASLIFSTMPTCIFPTAERLGLIPEGLLPRFAWQLLFFPLEHATYFTLVLSTQFNFSVLLILIGIFGIYSQRLRKIRVANMEIRAQVEHLYICQELYGNVCYVWMKVMLPPTILSLSIGIIISMFVSIRHTALPIYLYAIFPYCGLSLLFFVFWLGYDIVLITRDFEYIKGQLLCDESPYLGQKSKQERHGVMMRARAMRVIEFPVGDFADFSLNVPIVVWDEVINQVLFLLSFG